MQALKDEDVLVPLVKNISSQRDYSKGKIEQYRTVLRNVKKEARSEYNHSSVLVDKGSQWHAW